MRRWTILLAVAFGLAIKVASGQANVSTKEFCSAPPPGSGAGGVLSMLPGQSYVNGNHPESAEVGRLLAGMWDIVSVMTEGSEKPHAERWTIRLVSTDTAAERRCPMGPCRGTITFPAAGQVLGKGARFDSVVAAQNRRRSENDVAMSYDRAHNTLSMSVGPPMMDAGDLYDVSELTDSAFAGRWQSGGYFVLEVKRGNTTVFEKPSGYFCARRVQR